MTLLVSTADFDRSEVKCISRIKRLVPRIPGRSEFWLKRVKGQAFLVNERVDGEKMFILSQAVPEAWISTAAYDAKFRRAAEEFGRYLEGRF